MQQGLDYPFLCGVKSLFNIAIVDTIVKNTGGFKLDHDSVNSELFQAVVTGYISALL